MEFDRYNNNRPRLFGCELSLRFKLLMMLLQQNINRRCKHSLLLFPFCVRPVFHPRAASNVPKHPSRPPLHPPPAVRPPWCPTPPPTPAAPTTRRPPHSTSPAPIPLLRTFPLCPTPVRVHPLGNHILILKYDFVCMHPLPVSIHRLGPAPTPLRQLFPLRYPNFFYQKLLLLE